MHREFGLEGRAADVYDQYAEARTWVGGGRTLFNAAPHIASSGLDGAFPYTTSLVGKYLSTAWYQMQQIVNAGNRSMSTGQTPVDYNYHVGHIKDLNKRGGPGHFVRAELSFAKMVQTFTMPEEDRTYRNTDQPYGWPTAQVHPANVLGPARFDLEAGNNPALVAAVYEAVLAGLMTRWEQLPPSGVELMTDTDGDGAYCDEGGMGFAGPDYLGPGADGVSDGTEGALNDKACSDSWSYLDTVGNQNPIAQNKDPQAWYWSVSAFRDLGVSEPALDRMIDYGETLWPSGDWDALRGDIPDVQNHVTLQQGWNTVALPLGSLRAPLSELFGTTPEVTVVKDVDGNVFAPAYGVDGLQEWDATRAYEVYVTGDVDLPLPYLLPDPSSIEIPLRSGWNLLPYLPHVSMPIERALSSVWEHVEYVMDSEGEIFRPGSTDEAERTLSVLQPYHGYLIHITQDTLLRFPTDS